jgi:hypothetical protein
MNAPADSSGSKVVLRWPVLVSWLALLVVAFVTANYFWESLSGIGLRALLFAVAAAIVLWYRSSSFASMGVQQATLFALLILGLGAHFFIAWNLFSSGAIGSAQDVTQIQRAGTSLFLPFLGVAVGGVFGVKRLNGTSVDVHTFMIAISVIVLWDALAIGNLWAMQTTVNLGTDGWALEDVVRFAEDIMPLLAVLPAAAIGFYFGAQTGDSAPTSSATQGD